MNAKSSVVFNIAPWEETTNMTALEGKVRAIQKEGLTWGASELVPVVGAIFKLRIVAVVVDNLVSVDELSEQIQDDNSDDVQSVDIDAFVKI